MIPLVPYGSIDEYEGLLGMVAVRCSEMVVRCIGEPDECRVFSVGFDSSQREDFVDGLVEMYLELTKGNGGEWCLLMARMVAFTLNTAARVYVRCHPYFYSSPRRMDKFRFTMREEARNAVRCMDDEDNNTMCWFKEHNFERVRGLDELQPVGRIQDMKLAFAMGLRGGPVAGLGEDMVRHILSDKCF